MSEVDEVSSGELRGGGGGGGGGEREKQTINSQRIINYGMKK